MDQGGESGLGWPPNGEENGLGDGSPARGERWCLLAISGDGDDSGGRRLGQIALGHG
jgi:hypothetical protein